MLISYHSILPNDSARPRGRGLTGPVILIVRQKISNAYQEYTVKFSEVLCTHFSHASAAVVKILGSCPEQEFKRDGTHNICRHICHIIISCESYSNDDDWYEHIPKRPFHVDWSEDNLATLPDQHEAKQLWESTVSIVNKWLVSKTDEQWRAPTNKASWTGDDHLSRAIYMLQHLQYNLGLIDGELRARALPSSGWCW